MQDRDIGPCLRLPTQREERYLLPEALPANRRFYGKWQRTAAVSLSLQLPAAGPDPALHCEIPPQPDGKVALANRRGARGARLRGLGARRSRPAARRSSGRRSHPALRRAALNVVLSDLEAVIGSIRKPIRVAVVPLPDRPEVHVSYDNLLKSETRFGPDYEFIPDGAECTYQVRELLEGVQLLAKGVIASSRTTARPESATKTRKVTSLS